MKAVGGGVTAAQGFTAAGCWAGIKPKKPDLALVVCATQATAAAVFTANRIQAAPVAVSKAHIRTGKARAVILNSGNANCLMGASGLAAAQAMAQAVAQQLKAPKSSVLVASTGIIARPLPAQKVVQAVPALVAACSRAGHRIAAQAILTTDVAAKEAAVCATIQGRTVHVGGMAKGAGMIAPSMATMLCVITTDAAVAAPVLRALLKQAVAATFNRISVDGDMSTNDTVFLLASGASGVTIHAGTPEAAHLGAMLKQVCERLALLIVADGEGATKLMTVQVQGARSDREAQACARQVAFSPLVKTMLAGGDPNVGRIAGAVGASPARFDPQKLSIAIGGRAVVQNGVVCTLSAQAQRRLLKPKHVVVAVDLHTGQGRGSMLTCDLTHEYVRINAGYAT